MFKSYSDLGGKAGMIKLRGSSNWVSTFSLKLLKMWDILKENYAYVCPSLQKEYEDSG